MRRGALPALLFLLAAGGTLFLGSRILESERSSVERTARERLRARAREASSVLVSEATRAIGRPSGRTASAVLGSRGVRFQRPAEPIPIRRLWPLKVAHDAEAEFYLSEAQRAEVVDKDFQKAEQLYLATMGSVRTSDYKAVAQFRLAAMYRRLGRPFDALTFEKDFLGSQWHGDQAVEIVFEDLVVRARHPDKDLQADLLRTLGAETDELTVGFLRESGVPDSALDPRRRELRLMNLLRPHLASVKGVGQEVRVVDGQFVAWTVTANDLGHDPQWILDIGVTLLPRLPEGVVLGPRARSGDDLFETVEVGDPLPGMTVTAFTPRSRVEDDARRGAWMLGGALAALVLAGGAALVLSVRAARRETEAARARADLVTKVGHDLRTPLAVVRMYAETLAAGKVADPAEAREFAGIAAREAERLTGMVGQVLDLSRVAAPALPRSPLDLAAVAAEVAEVHRPLLEHGGIRLEVRAAGSLPVLGDSASLRGAVSNLLENAGRHGASGGSVEIESARDGTMAVVRVLDRGPGLPAGMEDRVFERFVRGPAAVGSGAGLGLALVREAAEAHGGMARASNREGGGAVFTVSVPLAKEEA